MENGSDDPQYDRRVSPNRTSPHAQASPAIERALNEHYRDFRRYLVRRVGDPATAEDILQNFCIRVLRHSSSLRKNGSAVAWLYTVLRSVLTDHYRREASRRRYESGYAEQRIILGEDIVEHQHPAGICACITKLIPELRSDYAQILFRVDIRNESRETLGNELNISPENIRVRLHRARRAMHKVLKSHCGNCCDTVFDDCFCTATATATGKAAELQLRYPN